MPTNDMIFEMKSLKSLLRDQTSQQYPRTKMVVLCNPYMSQAMNRGSDKGECNMRIQFHMEIDEQDIAECIVK